MPCVVADDLSEEQVNAFRLADNKTGELALWDDEKLAQELDGITGIDMEQFGFILSDEELEKEVGENPYTMKTNIPQYEPTGECPSLADLYDTSKTDELLAEIEEADLNPEEKGFHAKPEMQKLMEKSALVIIDVDDAIANGYANLAQAAEELVDKEEESENA